MTKPIDCKNNTNNTKFQPIIDEVNEISYIKKYFNLFDNRVSKFVNTDILEKQVNQKFEQNISTVKHDDPFKTAHIKMFELEKNEVLNVLKCLKEKERKSEKRKTTKDFDSQVEDAIKNKKT